MGTLLQLAPVALELARQSWQRPVLVRISAHGIRIDGTVSPRVGQEPCGLWFFLFRTDEGARGVMFTPDDGWAVLQAPPVPPVLIDGPALDLEGVVDSRLMAEHFVGQAGWEALAGRPEDGFVLGMTPQGPVTTVTSAGEMSADLDATAPERVLRMDFEPVSMRGECV